MRRLLVALIAAAALVGLPALLSPGDAAAHPLGNFTVNRYSRIELTPGQIALRYVVDMAEIPTFQERAAIDGDRNGAISDAEAQSYANRQAATFLKNLRVTVNGRPIDLTLSEREISFPPGQGGLDTLRLAQWYRAALPDGSTWNAEFRDDNYADRLGWKEIVVRGGPGIDIASSSVSDQETTDELLTYPEDMLQAPLNQREASFTFAPGAGKELKPSTDRPATAPVRQQDRFAELITRDLTLPVVLLSLLIAMGLGALHALGPGHGKTVVAAYLVGSRGTTKHAVFLGLTVTLTHTSSVFILGLVTLYLSNFILPEQLFPWLSFASGAGIAVLGLVLLVTRTRSLLARRAGRGLPSGANLVPAGVAPNERGRVRFHHAEHDHSHTSPSGLRHSHGGSAHSHLPPGATGDRVTWRSLLALGISGGIIPCPSALVVLLTAISIHRVGYGMLLIVAFSVGLAGVLTLIGLLLVHARGFFSRLPVDGLIARLTPVISAAAVTALGAIIAIRAMTGGNSLSV